MIVQKLTKSTKTKKSKSASVAKNLKTFKFCTIELPHNHICNLHTKTIVLFPKVKQVKGTLQQKNTKSTHIIQINLTLGGCSCT